MFHKTSQGQAPLGVSTMDSAAAARRQERTRPRAAADAGQGV